MEITLQAALTVVAAGQNHADTRNTPSVVAVVDRGGNLLAFAAHQDAILAARELAINKAYTALSLRADTAALDGAVQPGGPFFGLHTSLNNRPLVTFAGGRPLVDPSTGATVGAVGVSGGTLEDDTTISGAAADAFTAALTDGSSTAP